MNETKKSLAYNLKKYRNLSHKSQAELGKIFHVSQQTVASWETGRTTPGSDTLAKLADFYNVTADKLLGRNSVVTDADLEDMLDNARSFSGKPMSDHDREIIKTYLKGYYSAK